MSKPLLPQPVTKTEMAFGGNMKELLPGYGQIPNEFKNGNTYWNKLVSKIFFEGGSLAHLKIKDGIDRSVAICHIKAVLASWDPKHEHKEAGCAYLFSLWFEEPEKEAA